MTMSPDQLDEIAELRRSRSETRRNTVTELEGVLYEPIPVLDHGFVRVVDYMGDDSSVVQAARVSYGRGTRRVTEDRSLIHYLMRHRHTTPFEMAEIKLHVKLPIFVARQWIRHRTASVNEYSARYSVLDKEFYVPRREHLAAQSSVNRQGRGGLLEDEEARDVLEILKTDAERLYANYMRMLNEEEQGDARKPSKKGLARAYQVKLSRYSAAS
jgi:thymidylate synthase (FAD)